MSEAKVRAYKYLDRTKPLLKESKPMDSFAEFRTSIDTPGYDCEITVTNCSDNDLVGELLSMWVYEISDSLADLQEELKKLEIELTLEIDLI